MSETETGQPQPTEEPPAAEPIEQPGGPQDEPEPQPEPEPEQPDEPQPEQSDANEENYRKLDTKADNYFKGLRQILEGTDIPLAPCELCADAYPGVRWSKPQNDKAAAMLGIIGATESGSPLKDDPDAQLCDRCDGFGWTKLPAHVPGNTERICKKCGGAGWLDTNPQSGALQAPAPTIDNGQVEEIAGVPDTDPSVIDLRARGFTIIPPMKIGATEGQE